MPESSAAQLMSRLTSLGKQFDKQIATAATEQDIRRVKAAYLGKQGHLSTILKNLATLDPLERPQVGEAANKLKTQLEVSFREALRKRKVQEQRQRLSHEQLDFTLPGASLPTGHLHPITQVLQQVEAIFQGMGFDIQEGPEVESDYYNFEALNIPADHPARDMQDTFYLEAGTTRVDTGPLLLRTHTSPVQIRVMQQTEPPIQMIAPGPVYRRDSDVSHTPVFHQVEGLLVDRDVSFSHLKGVLEIFLHEFFGSEVAVRFRPSYFPFTEPSAEVDISCLMCGSRQSNGSGSGCRVCKQTGWLEVMGCGMVHPAVFRAVNYDPRRWSGFAFGIGIERLAMLKYRIPDIRLFYENDLRFLRQFR